MENKYCIGIIKDFTSRFIKVYVEDLVSYEKVFRATIRKEELGDMLKELKEKYPNSYTSTFWG